MRDPYSVSRLDDYRPTRQVLGTSASVPSIRQGQAPILITQMAPNEDIEMFGARDLGSPPSVELLSRLSVDEPPPPGAPPALDKSVIASIEILPNELLSNIFGFLDSQPPSASALHDEPCFEVTDSENQPLKAASCVSRRWRQATIPHLFKHARFTAQVFRACRSPTLSYQIQPLFEFINNNSLRKVVTSFTLLVHDKQISDHSSRQYRPKGFSAFWTSLFKLVDPTELLIVAPAEALGALTACYVNTEDVWAFDCPCQYLRLQRAPAPPRQFPNINESIPPDQYPLGEPSKVIEPMIETLSVENIPGNLLKLKPSNLDGFQDLSHFHSDTEAQTADTQQSFVSDGTESSTLFEVRPWTHLLLNEGSFVRAYSKYEFWLRRPPSILPDLVGTDTPSSKALISSTIRELSYIAVFPMSSHFHNLTTNLPRLNRLYVQLVPQNDILQNESKMADVQAEDLWMERNSCYALLMRELFNAPPVQNYMYLETFESGDAADRDAWSMAVEYVKRTGAGWRVGGDGIFVRDVGELVPEPLLGTEEESSSFDGNLTRWAWNGTTHLPVSAYSLYDRPTGPLT